MSFSYLFSPDFAINLILLMLMMFYITDIIFFLNSLSYVLLFVGYLMYFIYAPVPSL